MRNIVATLVVILAASSVSADGSDRSDVPANPRYVIEQIGAELGLATKVVTSMVKDRQGFIWFGTLDGLYRYDGIKADMFGKDEGLPSPYIVQLIVGPDGTVWAFTHEGAASFDGLRFVQFVTGLEEEFSSEKTPVLQRLAVDADSTFIASQNGLVQFDRKSGKKVKVWSEKDGLPSPKVTAVHIDTEGTVWFATGNSLGTLNASSRKVTMMPGDIGLPDESIRTILADEKGTIWIRTRRYLLRRDTGSERFIHDDEGLPGVTIGWGMPSLDRSGSPLVPSGKGLYYKERGEWTSISEKNGLSTDMVVTALEDEAGALWIGLGGAGIDRWPGRRSWAGWTKAEGLPANVVWSPIRDSRGRLWIGTSNGVGIWDPVEKTWVTRTTEDGVVGRNVGSLVEDPEGWVWGNSYGFGLTRFHPDTLEPQQVALPETCKIVGLRPFSPVDGKTWIACGEQLFTAVTKDGEIIFHEQQVPENLTRCQRNAVKTRDNVVWISGPGGIGRFDGESWSHFSTKDGLRIDFTSQLTPISGDEIWFGYHDFDGLGQLKLVDGRPTVRHFGKREGLPGDMVYMIGVDARGNIWAGGNAGLGRISKRDGSIRIFDRSDGLIWNDLSGRSFQDEPDGSFFVGTSRGLAHYNPTGDQNEEIPPNVVITSATLGKRQLLQANDPEVEYEDGTFRVSFSGLTAFRPRATVFRYRLHGLERDFVETTTREARYPSLRAGRYRFDVRCRSASGLDSEKAATFSFVVLPPWWETIWFRILAGLCVLLLAMVVLRWRTRRLIAERKRLEKAVVERSAELAEANCQLVDLAFTDALTSTRNRRYFSEVILEDISRVIRKFDRRSDPPPTNDTSIVAYMIDLDFFKQVNDIHGHLVGDQVLREFSSRLRDVVRKSDLVIRWGGEEFLVLGRDSKRDHPESLARRILESIGNENFRIDDDISIHLTCSLGWALFPWFNEAPNAVSFEQVLEIADQALYVAKQEGRNRSVGAIPMDAGAESERKGPHRDARLSEQDGKTLTLLRTIGTGRSSHPPGKR